MSTAIYCLCVNSHPSLHFNEVEDDDAAVIALIESMPAIKEGAKYSLWVLGEDGVAERVLVSGCAVPCQIGGKLTGRELDPEDVKLDMGQVRKILEK